MLSGPHQIFCNGIVSGLNATEAYSAAYPRTKADSARAHAPRLFAKPAIQAEISRMRAEAEKLAGSAVLTLAEKRKWLARLLRANAALLDVRTDGDLLAGLDVEKKKVGLGFVDIHKIRVCDKLRAIELDNDMAGDGAQAGADNSLNEFLMRLLVNIRSKPASAPLAAG